MVRDAARTETFAIGVAGDRGQVSVKGGAHRRIEEWGAVLDAENEVDEEEGE